MRNHPIMRKCTF